MQISSRFTVALHIFACVEYFKDTKVTSEFLSKSINTNPVIIRNILGKLSKAGLVKVQRGTGGIEIAKPMENITLYDVYKAVDPVKNGTLFNFHANPNPECPVGRNIHGLLDGKLSQIQGAMEEKMREYTIADMKDELDRII